MSHWRARTCFSLTTVRCLNYVSQLKWVIRPRNRSTFMDIRPWHLRQTMETDCSILSSINFMGSLIAFLCSYSIIITEGNPAACSVSIKHNISGVAKSAVQLQETPSPAQGQQHITSGHLSLSHLQPHNPPQPAPDLLAALLSFSLLAQSDTLYMHTYIHREREHAEKSAHI